jgi:uncharacterized protein (TIRG00374 family)
MRARRLGEPWRTALVWTLLAGATLLVVTRFASLPELARAFATAEPAWLAVAIALHLAYFVVYAFTYQVGFELVGVQSRVRDLLPVYFASNLANAVAPAGGAAAAAVFVADATRRGQSGARATVGLLVVLLADLATLVPFLGVGLAVVWRRVGAHDWLLAGAAIFTAFVAVLVVAIVFARRSLEREARILYGVEWLVNRAWGRLRHRPLLRNGWARDNATQLRDAANAVVASPGGVLRIALLGMLLHLVNASSLEALFLAFRQPVGAGDLIAGFSLGIVFFVIGIVPQGIAVVEGVMAFVFISLGHPAGAVAATVVSFRGLNFLLPVLLGLVFVRRIGLAPAGVTGRSAEG